MLRSSRNIRIHITSFLACTMFSFVALHILDTDDLGAKLTNYTLVNGNHLALIDEKLHETNSKGIFSAVFTTNYMHTGTCLP